MSRKMKSVSAAMSYISKGRERVSKTLSPMGWGSFTIHIFAGRKSEVVSAKMPCIYRWGKRGENQKAHTIGAGEKRDLREPGPVWARETFHQRCLMWAGKRKQ